MHPHDQRELDAAYTERLRELRAGLRDRRAQLDALPADHPDAQLLAADIKLWEHDRQTLICRRAFGKPLRMQDVAAFRAESDNSAVVCLRGEDARNATVYSNGRVDEIETARFRAQATQRLKTPAGGTVSRGRSRASHARRPGHARRRTAKSGSGPPGESDSDEPGPSSPGHPLVVA